MNLSKFNEKIQNLAVDVIGIGISNRPLIDYLAAHGARVTALDKRTAQELGEDVCRELTNAGVRLCLGEDYLEHLSGDLIFKTPGLRFDAPQLLAAKARGAEVTSEMEVFFEVCPAHIAAVTGSDGKTTTTTLIYRMLREEGYKTWVGGNIGTPLLVQADEMTDSDWVVLELSSFQLHTMTKSPERALITNITPNHLDMHKDYQEYIDAKRNIYLHQKPGARLVLNGDNPVTQELSRAKSCLLFSKENESAAVYVKDGQIYFQGEPVLSISDIKIPGMHNVENYMAAIAMIGDLVSRETIGRIAREFGGVEHRIELVRTVDGVRFYNSSIDSSPNRTINTLRVFEKPVALIAGGKDKGIPYDEIGEPILDGVCALILIGATSDKIEDAVRGASARTAKPMIPVFRAETYQEAVQTARENAGKDGVVLLSPASTSFDRFKNFEERGNLFKEIVNHLE